MARHFPIESRQDVQSGSPERRIQRPTVLGEDREPRRSPRRRLRLHRQVELHAAAVGRKAADGV